MKIHQVLFLTLAIIVTNNVALLAWLCYLSKTPTRNKMTYLMPHGSTRASAKVTSSDDRVSETDNNLGPLNRTPLSQLSSQKLDLLIADAIRNFISSREFERALDQHYLDSGPRLHEQRNRLTSMTSSKLYSVALGADDLAEQKVAQNVILTRLSEFDVVELNALYHSENMNEWGKQKLLARLSDKGDSAALASAKQVITDGLAGRYSDVDVFSPVYKHDPEYIDLYIEDLNLNDTRQSIPAIRFLMADRERSKRFYEKYLDRIINSTNSEIYRLLTPLSNLKLTIAQQSRLADLTGSDNADQRYFAISSIQSIKDVNLLRDTYPRLNNHNDKTYFLRILLRAQTDANVKGLAQEIAASSTDDVIKGIVQSSLSIEREW